MNIAIVDDSESDRQLLQELLIRYFDISGISITIYPFQSGELFLAGLSHHSFDLVFLDIFMDEITGMDAAHKLLEAGCDCTIIFLTSSREYALEGYEVGAFRYLLKPLTYDKLEDTLNPFLRKFRGEARKLPLMVERTPLYIPYSDLYYLSSVMRQTEVHLEKKVLK